MLVQKSLTALAVVALLSACGGGGGGGGDSGTGTGSGSSSSGSSSSSTSSSSGSGTSASASSSLASSASSASSATSSASSASSASSSSVASSSSSSSVSSSSSSSATSITSLGADGWASYGTNNLGAAGTTGGHGATAGKTYTVSTRSQLIQALYGNTATINADGSFSGTLDSSAKIIYVSGTISLNTNAAGTELTEDDYILGSCAKTSEGYTTASAMWAVYYAAYKPSVYGTKATNSSIKEIAKDSTQTVSGKPEYARACAAALQKKVVYIAIPSNTSIIGIGATAKIIHGSLVIGSSSSSPVDNVVIRNVAFEDSFDFFPGWDPSDSTTGRWNSAFDNVSINYATHVWLDHCTFSDGSRLDTSYPSVWNETYAGTDYASTSNATLYHVQHHDGLSDIGKSANYVTSSNNHYHDHDKSILIGGTDTATVGAEMPNVLKVTFHHNYFQNLRQRQPRVRYGMVHLYNNYFSGDLTAANYAWSVAWYAGQGAKLYVENNVVDLANGSPTASTLYGGSSSSSIATTCGGLSGMSTIYCSAYVFQAGNVLNGSAIDMTTVSATGVTTSTTPWPALGTETSAPSATPLSYYSYTLGGTSGLATNVPANAGVGKL